jgi:hypothetical protein
VEENVTVSADVGHVSVVQFAHSLQLLVLPPPSHVSDADWTTRGDEKTNASMIAIVTTTDVTMTAVWTMVTYGVACQFR